MTVTASTTDIADMGAVELTRLISDKQVSPVEALSAALDRVDSNSGLNAFMAMCSDRAMTEANDCEDRIMRGDSVGPLCGLPFSVKDLTDTEGVVTTYGSQLFADHVPTADAVAVARARAAGAVLIGKTTTPEFGHKPFTEGPHFGRTLNPWNPDYTCGGSSGGAATAVATGMGQLALGSDGAGSLRIPAACCGVAGFKATLGAIPNLQAPDLFGVNSYVGPMARNVADTRLLFEAVRGAHPRDPYGQSPQMQWGNANQKPLRIGLVLTCGNRLDDDVRSSVLKASQKAEVLGMHVEPLEVDFVSFEQCMLTLLRSTFATRLGKKLKTQSEMIDPTLVATIRTGLGLSAVDLNEALYARTECFRNVQELFEQVDILLSPTISAPALPVGLDPLGEIEIAGKMAGTIRGAWYPYTLPFNLTGHPAISIPCGLSDDGLPIGLQLVGRWHDDDRLLDVAENLEAAIAFPSLDGSAAR